MEGLTPIAFSANGKHLLANFVGQDPQDHTEAYTVDLTGSKPLWRDLTGQGNGNIGDAISADGKTILLTKGMTANLGPLSIETVPWSGGKPTTIVPQGAYASWNRPVVPGLTAPASGRGARSTGGLAPSLSRVRSPLDADPVEPRDHPRRGTGADQAGAADQRGRRAKAHRDDPGEHRERGNPVTREEQQPPRRARFVH